MSTEEEGTQTHYPDPDEDIEGGETPNPDSDDEKDLSEGFTPGVRFFFRYNDLIRHPGAIFEGVLPLKIRDEVVLNDWVSAIIVPEIYRQQIEPAVPKALRARVHFLRNDCKDIWEWSEKVYEYVKKNDAQ